MAIQDWPETAKKKAKEAWEWIKSLFPPPPEPPPKKQKPKSDAEAQPSEPDAGRYQVQDQDENVVYQDDSLGSALQAWRELTDQEGSIVDTETGEDVTPEKDENGRFAVLSEDGEQIGTFNDFELAKTIWESETDKLGTIIDTKELKDVTPFEGHLSDEEVQAAVDLVTRLAHGGGIRGFTREFLSRNQDGYSVDLDNVKALIPAINELQLPIFKLSNAVGSGIDAPTHTVTVTKREAMVDHQRVEYYEDVPVDDPPTSFQSSPTPQDERVTRPMRTYDEVTRARPIDLAMPGFGRRYAEMSLPVVDQMEEVQGEAPTKRMRKYRIEETIVPREWQEEIEVTDDQRVQFLSIVCDISGSMYGGYPQNIDMAVALIVVLITKHLDDESHYTHRWFGNYIDDMVDAESRREKEALIKFAMDAEPKKDIGYGTNIQGAVSSAAGDVRGIAVRDNEIPEVLLITDGEDMVYADEIFRAIGTDVILHTIVVNGSNMGLKQHSTTYEELNPWQLGFGSGRAGYDISRW